MWICKTPLRASFFGGGTDYPAYFNSRPGAVLGGTIDKYVFIQALPLSPIAEQKFRVTYRTTESVDEVDAIKHPVIREALKLYGWRDPLNIATMSDLPGGTGLGSSSAFTVGFINLLHQMQGIELTRYELARHAIDMEQVVLKEQVGIQDQVHAAFGGFARYEFNGGAISIEPLRLATHRLAMFNASLLLVYTGVQRNASDVTAEQQSRTSAGLNFSYLNEMYEMTKVGARILESEGDDLAALVRFADLLDHGWKLKRQLGNAVSNSSIDEIYMIGRELGAWGGKLLGAGGGGFVLFMADPSLHPLFSKCFGAGNVIPVSMVTGGSVVLQVS